MRTDRIDFLDLRFDRLTLEDVKVQLQSVSSETSYGYVVTPNVDHVVFVHRHPEYRTVYETADLCLCDSRILKALARLRGIKLPLVPGSDLCATLLSDVINPGDRVAIVGGSKADIEHLRAKFRGVDFLHFDAPAGLRANSDARRDAAKFVASSKARFALLAVGSPQQEMIALEARQHQCARGVALCIGAGLDFISGKQKRAPRLVQLMGLEWAHRLARNPRRLWRRYLVEDLRIVPIYLSWRKSPRGGLWGLASLAAVMLGGVVMYGGMPRSEPGKGNIGGPSSREVPPANVAEIKLPPPNLLKPLSPEQALKENAERPFVKRVDSPAASFVLRTDSNDRERALTCLTQAVYYEAASEGVDGGRAIAQVVLNRMRHPGYPASVCGVVYQGADRPSGCQFTFVCDGSMLRAPIASLWARSRKIAQDALAGKVFAPIGHATHYHADYVLPYWADSLDKTVQIGRHIFYRLRSTFGDSRSFFQRYAGTEPDLPKPADLIIPAPGSAAGQLASALISDALQASAPNVEKAAPAASPLIADSAPAKLIADEIGAAIPAKKRKPSSDCSATRDGKKLMPLGATDMRASANTPNC